MYFYEPGAAVHSTGLADSSCAVLCTVDRLSAAAAAGATWLALSLVLSALSATQQPASLNKSKQMDED